jgi:hypothetical protein
MGTLTWAVYQANYSGGDINYINFNIPRVSGEVEITLTETLYIARPMIINATTEPGYAGQPLIRINCGGLSSGFNIVSTATGVPPLSSGVASSGAGSTIQGFRIVNFRSNAITVSRGADSNLIANNQLGFTPLALAGTFLRNVTLFPGCRGIGIQSSSNIVRDNTISGVDNAITVGDDIAAPTGRVYRNNSFERNFIGTDPTGTTKIGNDSDGIFLGAGAKQNFIGPDNVLSGMLSSAVEILHATATDNVIFGNTIGLNATGTDTIPNGELGVLIANGASSNWVGGPYGGAYPGNVISGNPLGGIAIGTDAFPGPDGSNNNQVEGNFIGTDGLHTSALGIQLSGITVQSNSKDNILRRNVIVGQVNHGIVLSNATHNAIYGNWIGMGANGASIGNGGFGVYAFNASNNTIQLSSSSAGPGTEPNVFGQNTLGSTGVDGTSAGNIVELTPTITPTPTPAATKSQLVNISTRLRFEAGDNALIGGFIITGTEPKKVIIRGIGPSLPVTGALQDPMLELHDSTGAIIASNDNWKEQQSEVEATTIPPVSDAESAIVATLPANSAAYTAILRGTNNSIGVGLVEVYDLDTAANSKLANISTRGLVDTGNNVMIGGFIIGGNSSSKVIVRAIGPSLPVSGALQDPTLELHDSNGGILASNDDWRSDHEADIIATTVAPLNDRESAIVQTLAAGAYTAIVRGANNSTGVGLVEVYNLP